MQYFGADGLGSVRQLYNSSGQIIAHHRYDPFGNTISQSGVGTSNYGFTGEWTDATGLEYLRARYYAPTQGRFVTRDVWPGDYQRPLSLNKWLYVQDNPVNAIDPNGQCPIPPPDFGSAICMDLFIKPERVSVAGGLWVLHGDGRDFSDHSDPGASRGYIWISVDQPREKSQMNFTGYIHPKIVGYRLAFKQIGEYIEWFPPSSQSSWMVNRPRGSDIEVVFNLVLAGYLETIAPHINGTIRFMRRPDGGYGAVGVRDGYPWAEAYYHDGKGNVQTIFRHVAINDNPENLNAIEDVQLGGLINPGPLYWCRDVLINRLVNQTLLQFHPQKDFIYENVP